MKNFPRITAAVLMTTVLLGTGVATSAVAEESSPPAVLQSNIQITDSDLTDVIYVHERGAGSYRVFGVLTSGGYINNSPDVFTTDAPIPASPEVMHEDGSMWRAIFRDGQSGDGLRWIRAEEVVSSEDRASYELAIEVAEKAVQTADEAAREAAASFSESFVGSGIVKTGGTWHAEDDADSVAVATAAFPGTQARMSEPYKGSDGQQWRKMGLADRDSKNVTVFVLDSNVKDFKADTPSTPAPTYGATAGPNQPGNQPAAPLIPAEEMETSPSSDATAGSGRVDDSLDDVNAVEQVDGTDPGNTWPLVGGALVLALGAGSWLLLSQRRKVAGAKEVSAEDTEAE